MVSIYISISTYVYIYIYYTIEAFYTQKIVGMVFWVTLYGDQFPHHREPQVGRGVGHALDEPGEYRKGIQEGSIGIFQGGRWRCSTSLSGNMSYITYIYTHYRRKFRSETSDNMDR